MSSPIFSNLELVSGGQKDLLYNLKILCSVILNARPNSLFPFQVSSIVSPVFQRNKALPVFGVEILPMSLGTFQHKL